jgi:hypothetical protein
MSPDGQPAGYLLTRAGHGTGLDNVIYKVWRNPTQGGRWWFKVITGTGTTYPPTQVGQSIEAAKARFRVLPFIAKRRLAQGKTEVVFYSEGNVWVYDDQRGTLTCILSAAQYMGAEIWKRIHPQGKPVTTAAPENGFSARWELYPEHVSGNLSDWLRSESFCRGKRGDPFVHESERKRGQSF